MNIGLARDPALHHDSKFLGDIPGEVELLLDQNDRQLLLVVDALDDPLDLLDDRRLDTLGRLVQEKEFRIAAERARDRQLLLLATAEQTTRPVHERFEHRKEVEDLIGDPLQAVVPRDEPETQVVHHGDVGEDLTALGHVADAKVRAPVDAHPRDVVTLEGDRAAPGRGEADDALQEGRLADAVPPEHAFDLALLDAQGKRVQDMARAIERVDVANVKERH